MKHILVQLPNGEWLRVEGSSERDLQEKLGEVSKTFRDVQEKIEQPGDPRGKPWENYGREFQKVPDWVAEIQYNAGMKSGIDFPSKPPMNDRDARISHDATMLSYTGRSYSSVKSKPVAQENDSWKLTCFFGAIIVVLAIVTIIYFR